MNIISTILFLGLLGVVIGVLLGWLTNRGKTRQRKEKLVSVETTRQLSQLKSQLDSGLITKEEYETKKQEILKEL